MANQDEEKIKGKKGKEKRKKDAPAEAAGDSLIQPAEPFGELVKFIITQPTDLNVLAEFDKSARQSPDLQIKFIAGSVEQGNYYVVSSRKGLDLTGILAAIPSVQQVVEIQDVLAVSLKQPQEG